MQREIKIMYNIKNNNVSGNKVAIGTQQLENTATETVQIKFNNFFTFPIEDLGKTIKFYEANRGYGTDMDRVEEIAYDIVNNNTAWMIQPLCIDKKEKIILDGNHTGNAILLAAEKYNVVVPNIPAMELERPKGMSIATAVQILNNERKPWTLPMYIENNIREGNINYKRLSEMGEELGPFFIENDGKVRWRYLSSLAGTSQQKELRSGKYILTKQMQEEQISLGREIVDLWNTAGKPNIGPWTESFIFAYFKERKEVGVAAFKILLKLIQQNKIIFDGSTSTKIWYNRLHGEVDKYLCSLC